MSALIGRQIDHDFSELHERMQWYIDEGLIPCCASVVMHGPDVVDYSVLGFMDLESGEPLREDAIYRIYSNTKPITSVAAMMLYESGRFGLDDPIEDYLPEFADMRVLRPGAAALDDTVPAELSITPRHLLSHTAGLTYAFLEPDSLIGAAYLAAGLDTSGEIDGTLEELSIQLAEFPLVHQPGTKWRYSLATDVVARLIEVVSGVRFDDFLRENILEPLGMDDTGFCVPPERQDRFTTMYAAADPLDPMVPGLVKDDDPYQGRWSQPPKLLSGGGGLVSSVPDYLAFVRMLANGGEWNGARILAAETLRTMRSNQLAAGVEVRFPGRRLPGTVFGLGFSLLQTPDAKDPPGSRDEYRWGGLAGTTSWLAPNSGLVGVAFTQRMPAFFHPFLDDFRRLAYASVSS